MPEQINPNAVRVLSYGMYVVSSKLGEKLNGQIANTVFQTTADPQQLSVCINHQNLTWEYIDKSGYFGVSVLGQDATMEFIGLFGFKSGRNVDKLSRVKYKIGAAGLPLVLDHALSVLEAKVVGSLDMGTHTLFVGQVVAAEVLKTGRPMTYDFYHRELKGKAPKTAPTYVADSSKEIKM